jgi:hypothetical protein
MNHYPLLNPVERAAQFLYGIRSNSRGSLLPATLEEPAFKACVVRDGANREEENSRDPVRRGAHRGLNCAIAANEKIH